MKKNLTVLSALLAFVMMTVPTPAQKLVSGDQDEHPVPGDNPVPDVTQQAQTPLLICSLQARPSDRILFNENHYESNPIDILIRVENIGDVIAQNVQAFILKDNRFTIDPNSASRRQFGALPAGERIDFGDNDGFGLIVHPRSTDGWDTVRVLVVADSIPETLCEIPIFIEAEKRPVWDMTCTSIALLSYDEFRDDYMPNPFEVTTTVKNVGEVPAHDCWLICVTPMKLTPSGQRSMHTIDVGAGLGVLPAKGSYTFIWNMSAILQEIASTEEIIFQISGKGGLGNDLVLGECRVPITIPPRRGAVYEFQCSSPAEIPFDDASGTYIPDPFQFKVRVKNIGDGAGQDIKIEPDFTGNLILANGEDPSKTIAHLAVDEEAEIIWLVNIVATAIGETANLCVDLTDKFKNTARCCSQSIIAPATEASLLLKCYSEFDHLVVNPSRGDYEVNPFRVFLEVTNNGQRVADSVEATLIPLTRDLLISPPSIERVLLAERLNPGESISPAAWFLRAVPRLQSGDVQVKFIVRAKGLAARECVVTIYIPEIGRPVLDCNGTITTNVTNRSNDNTLSFDENTGDFEGMRSSTGGDYNVFRLTVNVHNRGEAQANNVRVILTPDGAVFDDGFPASQSIGDISANSFKATHWDLRPLRDTADFARTFNLRVFSDNADLTGCSYTMTIQAASTNVDVSIARDLVGQKGENIVVPVYIGPTIGRDLRMYKLSVKFDPEVLEFLVAIPDNTLPWIAGWNGLGTKLLKSDPAGKDDVVRVEDYTLNATLNNTDEGILTYLIFEAVYSNANGAKPDSASTDLEFIPDLTVEGKTYISSMNSAYDNRDGDISLRTHNGFATVSGAGSIAAPDDDSEFHVAQNYPNPFNPETTIRYTVPENSSIRLRVYSTSGELVRELVNNNNHVEGSFSVTFEGEALASGTYIAVINMKGNETGMRSSKTIKMTLSK